MFLLPECITWFAVGPTECVTIVTLNIITIIVFVKNRNLRKRSTYLVINLAVCDMLAGGFAVIDLFYLVGVYCNNWKYNLTEDQTYALRGILSPLFSLCSITNITLISVERLHATLRPFRHRVIKKCAYGIIITIVWATAGVVIIAYRVLYAHGYYGSYLWDSFVAFCLLVICVSYACIVIKIRCGAQAQHHGAASRERKLTMTLLTVTVVSLLLYLPYVIFSCLGKANNFFPSMSYSWYARLDHTLRVLFYANSLVNPILYAICIPEFRSAVLALFRRRPQQQRQVQVLPLCNL